MNINNDKVRQLAEQIAAGDWELAPSDNPTIPAGDLLDGQHRLKRNLIVEEHEREQRALATAPPCTGSCRGQVEKYVDLPCGCQDVHYWDGTICYEHNHVECDGTPWETPDAL